MEVFPHLSVFLCFPLRSGFVVALSTVCWALGSNLRERGCGSVPANSFFSSLLLLVFKPVCFNHGLAFVKNAGSCLLTSGEPVLVC